MASGDKYTIQEDTLTNIGNAIRQMTDSQEGITPEDMPEAIRSINTGSDYPVLYGTTDPTSDQGSDGQLYAKYANTVDGTVIVDAWLKMSNTWTPFMLSGEDGGSAYTKIVLYDGLTVSGQVTLSDSYKNYDALIFEVYYGEGEPSSIFSPYIPTDSDIGVCYLLDFGYNQVDDSKSKVYFEFSSNTSLNWLGDTNPIYKVIGIKFGGDSDNSWTDLTATLTAGSTNVTISDNAILTTSTIDIYTDTFGINPTNVVVSTGSIVLTFEAQQSDVGVKVRVS